MRPYLHTSTFTNQVNEISFQVHELYSASKDPGMHMHLSKLHSVCIQTEKKIQENNFIPSLMMY